MPRPNEKSPEVRCAFLISGHVQGVGFRWWTRQRAEALGIRGMVRNLPDGRVRVDAEGNAAALARFRDLLREGPSTAQVAEIESIEPQPGPYPDGFRVAR